jgi:hypothetical protein
MTTELTFLDNLDQLPDEIPGAQHLDPGRLSWLHGTNAAGAKTPGVFYAKDTAFIEPPDAPWIPDARYEDQSETGYSAPVLRIAILGERSQWFLPGQDRGDLPEWIQGYQPGAKKLTEYLVAVEGIADPMVLSVSGKYKAGPFAKIISDYRRGALAQAMRRVKRTLPLWSFWLEIGGRKDAAGKPLYEKAMDGDGKEYGSIVTVPVLLAPPIPRTASELVEGGALWSSYGDWLKYKRLPQGTTEAAYVVSAPPALPPGRNVPQLIEDVEAF